MIQISLCITTYNRADLTLDSFKRVYDDERIGEIIIVDDASDLEYYEPLKLVCDGLPKVKLYRNEININCYKNKIKAISLASFDYCLIFDSDNILDTDYLDALYSVEWGEKSIYAPVFAKPTFNYEAFSGLTITKENVAMYMDKPMFSTALNTSNYFFNKKEMLETIDKTIEPNTSEAIYTNYCWLKKGNSIYFVPNMTYSHLIHSGSHYQNNCHKDPQFYTTIENNLRNMK